MKHIQIITFFAFLLLVACKSKGDTSSDQDKLETSARTYFFLDDSVDVSVNVLDTLHVEELDKMLETIEENERLINLDIDTLGKIIEDLAYGDEEPKFVLDQVEPYPLPELKELNSKVQMLEYDLKYEKLIAQRLEFIQSKRVFLNLKRAAEVKIAGYNAEVSFTTAEGEKNTLLVLMDANYRIVD
ncbi:MAG: hypothetical protein MI810_22265 [Flavobacteriales bacterium]|jgi:hypothetical protein|nr:hypothetical protein [Flavobacteriales bacterium]